MNTIFNKFIPSCFRPGFNNDAGRTEQASGPQPGPTSAMPHPQQRGERRSFFSKFAKCFTPYDLVAKLTGFGKFQAQANAELQRAKAQLNAAIAEFNQRTETLRNNGYASSSMPHQNGYSSSYSNSPSSSHTGHTSRPSPSAPTYPQQTSGWGSFHSSSFPNSPSSSQTGHAFGPHPSTPHHPQQTNGWASTFTRLFTPYDPIARMTGFDRVRDEAYRNSQYASQHFNQVRDQFNGQAQQASQQLEHIFNTMFMPHSSPFNFEAHLAAHLNPNLPPPIRFTSHPIVINSSMGNNISENDMRGMVEHLHQGGFSHAQLRELAEDLKTLKENIGGTDVNNEIVNSIRQRYARAFLLQSDQDLASPVFEKMIPAIHAFLDRNRNTGS